MYCRKCGASGANGKFCRYCGASLIDPTPATDRNETEIPNNPQASAPEMGNQQPYSPEMSNPQAGNPQYYNPQADAPQAGNPQYYNPQADAPQAGNPQYYNPQAGNPQMNNFGVNQNYMQYNPSNSGMRHKKKSRAPIVIVALIALVAVIAVFAGKLFNGSSVVMRMSSPEKYYQSIEKKNLENLSAHMANLAELTGRKGSDTSLSLTLTDDGKSFIEDADLSWLNSVSLDLSTSSSDTGSYAEGTLGINNTKIIDFALLKEISGEMFIKVPEYSQLYAKISERSKISGFMDVFGSDVSADTVIDRYGDIVISNLNNVEKVKETVTVGSTSAEYDAFIVTIDSVTEANIAREIAATAREDRELENLIRSLSEILDEDADSAYADFLADLDEAANYDESQENTVILTMTLYVDGSGEVFGRRFVSAENPDKQTYYLTARNGKNFESEVKLSTGDGLLSVNGSGTRSGNKISGDYTLYVEDVHVATVSVKDFDKKAAREGQLDGSFTFAPGKDYIDETGGNPLTASLKYKIDIASKQGKADATVSILSDAASLGTLKISGSSKKGSGVPAVSDDEKADLNAWMNSIDTDQAQIKLQETLTKAGVPEEYFN